MQQLSFLLFITRLGFSLLTFLTQLLWHLHSRKIIVSFSLIFILLNSLSYLSIQKTSPDQAVVRYNQKFLKEELDKQLEVLENQPTHRDVLYNLSVIYEKIGNQEKSDEYLEKAKYQDPNHPVFE